MLASSDLQVGNGAKVGGNVLTCFSDEAGEKPIGDQEDNASAPGANGVTGIIAFKDSDTLASSRRRRSRKAKGKRGPRGSKGLAWADGVKAISDLDRLARRAGLVPAFVTIRAPKDKPLVEGKGFIQRKTAHLGQALQRDTRRRKGKPHYGLTVYEIGRTDGHLHAHHMVYLANRADMKIVARFADVFEKRPTRKRHDVAIHARPACETDIGYMTKQRLPLSPDVEAKITHMRQPGGFIPGPRWSATGHLRAMQEKEARASEPSIRLVVSNPVETAPTTSIRQFGLPLDWRPSRPITDAALMVRFCEVFGYTQQQAAERLGYRDRSHVANIIRGHDGMSPARRKWIEYLLETGLAA